MEEFEYSYSDNNRRMNYGFLKNFGAMNLDPNVSPKLSARNSYTGDSPDDYNDVFGGPPKYITFMQSPKEHGEGRLLLAPSGGFSRLRLFDEIPVFGETRRRYVNDEFYNDIFNPDPVFSAGETSDKCSVTSRSTPRNLSPAGTPLTRIAEHKTFGTGSPFLKLRQAGIASKQAEYPLFGTSPHHGLNKCLDDSTVVSSAQSSPQVQSSPLAHSSDLLEVPFGSSSKSKKMLQGLKKNQDVGGLPPRTSNSRFQSFLETRESILQGPARLNNDKLYSTPQIPSCSNTSDDEWGNSIHRLHARINRGVSKPVIKRHSSDTAKSVNSIEKADDGFEKARLSSASDVPFTEHRRLVVSSPSRALHAQAKVKSWRDWVPESKGLYSNQESESPSVGSSEISSTKEIDTNTGVSSAQVSQEIESEPLVDSGEESDDLGSYVIEINAQKGETFGFLPEKDIQVDTNHACNSLTLSTKETVEWAKEKLLPRSIAEGLAHHAKGGKLKRHSDDVDSLENVEARMQVTQKIGKSKAFSNKSSTDQQTAERSVSSNSVPEVICSEITMEQTIYSAASPTVAREKVINEVRRVSLADPYSVDFPSMMQEVSQRIERWQCEKPVVFREISVASERKDSLESCSDEATARETPAIMRKGLEKERRHQSGERLLQSKIVVEKKQNELEAERGQAEKIKSPETLDSEIKRWSAGKEGNIRALLSTMQYVLSSESGWKPVPLIEIIEGVAVKKAYQKARLCVHPDKLQQKGATFQQKYIAKRVFDILQEAWTIFNSSDPF